MKDLDEFEKTKEQGQELPQIQRDILASMKLLETDLTDTKSLL